METLGVIKPALIDVGPAVTATHGICLSRTVVWRTPFNWGRWLAVIEEVDHYNVMENERR